MATSRGQTHNKRARELALKEKRERKQAKKEDRRLGIGPDMVDGEITQDYDGETAPADESADDVEQPDAELEP